ncbi:hypothetical protein [Ovoidimarina sediminis]|uniref:hypothetical protein n=1 Tax=Ovoidimarina sediminis TaxID=3079856 RepID=UPI002909C8F5|nr:hypothetical protein [Rhodophyticola sp. MJ-SS7]MDU8943750.1 hypothetical protein [Rhodophyticola sp. MJ-SS7]
MTVALAPMVRVGDLTCCAVVKTDVHARGFTGCVTGVARREPALLLFAAGGVVGGVDLRGRTFTTSEIEACYPGMLAAFALAR